MFVNSSQRNAGLVRRNSIRGLACILLLHVSVLHVSAHEGPPYPVITDQMMGPFKVSVWTDPDVGTGTFLIFPEPMPGKSIPADLQVDVTVQPVSKRLAEATYHAVRDDLSDRAQFKGLVNFDAQEFWNVRVTLHSSEGGGEGVVQVEATPPGYGRWDLLIYLFPFLGVGFLWTRMFFKRRSIRRSANRPAPPAIETARKLEQE